MKDELGKKIMTEFASLRPKTYVYLTDNNNENKKTKHTKSVSKHQCLEVTQLETKINQSKNNKLDMNSLRENHEEFIKNNKLILNSQQRIRSEKHNVFTEKVNKVALSANDHKIMELIGSIETYPRD